MRAFLSALVAVAAVAAASTDAHAGERPAPPQVSARCDVSLNVADPDPRGLNVRAAPGTAASVIAVLKPDVEWITVHAIAQQGDWIRIDRAVGIDDDAPNGERVVFRGDGWVHLRLLGVSSLFVGGGATLRQRPDAAAPPVFTLHGDDALPTRVLGCSGRYIRVRYGERVGWTDRWCNNERTTCS